MSLTLFCHSRLLLQVTSTLILILFRMYLYKTPSSYLLIFLFLISLHFTQDMLRISSKRLCYNKLQICKQNKGTGIKQPIQQQGKWFSSRVLDP